MSLETRERGRGTRRQGCRSREWTGASRPGIGDAGRAMRFRAVLFDLDGTLLDTLEDIAQAANDVLVGLDLPAHPPEAYRAFIGDGVATLFRRALPPDRVVPEMIDRCVAGFRETYGESWNVRTRPFDGIPEL